MSISRKQLKQELEPGLRMLFGEDLWDKERRMRSSFDEQERKKKWVKTESIS